MNNQTIIVKFQQRLNKLASFDYDNVEKWMMLEAFNKAQVEFARRQIKKGEVDKQIVEDINGLIKEITIKGNNETLYFQTEKLPDDFLAFNRLKCEGVTKDCKTPRPLKVYLGEQANLDELLNDPNKNPDFEWGETFLTFIDNSIRIYTNNLFKIINPYLIYYSKPSSIKIAGVFDLESQQESVNDVNCVFKDDVIELLIDEACIILAGDIENFNRIQTTAQNIQRTE